MENIRIDKGLKRKIRQEARAKPLVKRRHWTVYDQAKRTELIKALPEAILQGKTTTQFAEEHNIPHSTLKSWVLGNDEVEGARGAMLASELMIKIEEIQDSGDALALARAREGFRAWSWIAERREHRLYGQRSHVEVSDQPLSAVDKELLGSAQELLALIKEKRQEKLINAPAAMPEKPLESE